MLSLIEAPEIAVPFFHNLQHFRKHRDVFVDLSRVIRLTPDAVALLLSIVKKLGQSGHVHVSGNYPQDPVAMATIRESGFDQYLRSSLQKTAKSRGAIVQRDFLRGAKQAEGRFAQELIDFAIKSGQADVISLKATYGHLVDCMTNTHEHAGQSAGSEQWWASAFHDVQRNCHCFTFVDMGVGIVESIELNLRLKIFNLLGVRRPTILRKLLAKEIPSSTGLSYRGRGLPSIQSSMKAGAINRLVIVTNNVYADVHADRFVQLPFELKGLLLYWEVDHERSRKSDQP